MSLSRAAPLVHSSDFLDSGLLSWGSRPGGMAGVQSSTSGPVIASNFPDPAVISVDGYYYAFSTSSGTMKVPWARTAGDGKWAIGGTDALPAPGAWSTGKDIWAPDVVQLVSGWKWFHRKPKLMREGRRHVRYVL